MITVLCGGTGAAKFMQGLQRAVPPARITAIVNTGDDLEWWGLNVSPDVDSIMYGLAGMLSRERGWGVENDTFECMERMKTLGAPGWFSLGDRDLATHVQRTGRMKQGETLTQVTAQIAAQLGVAARILPMSDDAVHTRVMTAIGELSFQEYFVRERHSIPVTEVKFVGAESARPAPGVLDAIRDSERVIVAPSNPITSIGPILAVPGIRDALRATKAEVVAISPIVGGTAVSGPAGDLMRAHGFDVSVLGVAQAYRDFVDVMVVDEQDRNAANSVAELGVAVHVCTTIMRTDDDKLELAKQTLIASGRRGAAARLS